MAEPTRYGQLFSFAIVASLACVTSAVKWEKNLAEVPTRVR
ncbi:hypothetical protein HMPREF0294_2059 [Corynebacterium glucuronolyticum ATCC 51867]|nr:hypothetical protein HMPREF0294_2059 [Corynebacterium glucuronolyticum ATCC 51867]